MSRLLAMAIPVPKGNEKNWQQFIRELKEQHQEEFESSRQKLEVRERTFFQQTPTGAFVIVTLEGYEPELALQRLAKRKDAFTKWFVQKVKEVYGIDLVSPSQELLPHMVIDSGPVEEFTGAIF